MRMSSRKRRRSLCLPLAIGFDCCQSLKLLLISLAVVLASLPSLSIADSVDDDKVPCLSSAACLNEGSCYLRKGEAGGTDFECLCKPGFEGQLCETPVSIRTMPTTTAVKLVRNSGATLGDCRRPGGDCRHDEVCLYDSSTGGFACYPDLCREQPCAGNATCRTLRSDFLCQCPKGTQGKLCEQDVDECREALATSGSPKCHNGGTCINILFTGFRCDCPAGFGGELCEKTVEAEVEQKPHFSCDSRHQLVVDSSGHPACVCSEPAATGPNCDTRRIDEEETALRTSSSGSCSPKRNPCLNEAKCVSIPNGGNGGAICLCSRGFTGQRCESQLSSDSLTSTLTPPITPSSKARQLQLSPDQTTTKRGFAPERSHGFPSPPPDPFTSVFSNHSCADCVNAAKCVVMSKDRGGYCLCADGFYGVLCDVQRESECSRHPRCERSGEVCQLRRTTLRSEPYCACPAGFGGDQCTTPSTVTFEKTSVLLDQNLAQAPIGLDSRNSAAEYRVEFAFRTTLDRVEMASGESILGELQFAIGLDGGRLVVRLGEKHISGSNLIALQLNDDDWYGVRLEYVLDRGAAVEVWHEGTGFLLARRELGSRRPISVLTTRFGRRESDNYLVGCLRSIRVNGQSVDVTSRGRSVDLMPGCSRREQCSNSGSNSESVCKNGGVCVDMWSSHSCKCQRPYTGASCEEKAPEATFGHGNLSTRVRYSLASTESELVRSELDLSFLMRTNAREGAILYLGESDEEELGTFIEVELLEGYVHVNTRTGGRAVLSTAPTANSTRRRIDDNRVHLVRIKRTGNRVEVLVDEEVDSAISVKKPFAHPLLADTLVLGSSKTLVFPYKGTLQDMRINNRLVSFDNSTKTTSSSPSPVSLQKFGELIEAENLLPGMISDDVCAQLKPCVNGECVNMFNDYECKCHQGWIGSTCEAKNFCKAGGGNVCPPHTKCQNSHGGYICLSTATLTATSSVKFSIRFLTPPVSSLRSNVPKQNNVSLELRTRSSDGHILKLLSESDSLSLEIRGGTPLLTYTNQSYSAQQRIPASSSQLNDAQWHSMALIQHAVGQPLQLVIDGGRQLALVDQLPYFNLSALALQTNSGDLILGRASPNASSVKGCVRNIRYGSLPPLVFDTALMGNLDGVPHFSPVVSRNLRSDGCHSNRVCGEGGVAGGGGNPCTNGGQCEDVFNAFRCRCPAGFEGERCELPSNNCRGGAEVADRECNFPHGRCVSDSGSNPYHCQCAPGFAGPECRGRIDSCRDGNSIARCMNGGRCIVDDEGDGFHCACPSENFIGRRCQWVRGVVKCSDGPCENGGTCSEDAKTGLVQCRCAEGFFGHLCDSYIDPCVRFPCVNGGECSSNLATIAPPHSTFGALVTSTTNDITSLMMSNRTTGRQWPILEVGPKNNYTCSCTAGWTGLNCEQLDDVCSSNATLCSRHGNCRNIFGGHLCDCHPGWRGSSCEKNIDECEEEAPCENGAVCVNTIGSYQCECAKFYEGERCQLPGVCASEPCQNDGECMQHSINNHTCVCPRGFRGKLCEEQIDYCQQDPCMNGATCRRQVGGFQCLCIKGFEGRRCETDIDECAINRCANNGTCLDRVNGFECNCNGTGFQGPQCLDDVDECRPEMVHTTCVHGECNNTVGGYACTCRTGFIGPCCNMADPCIPDAKNQTLHNCAHGHCVRPTVVRQYSGREVATHECECFDGYAGSQCTLLTPPPQRSVSMGYVLGLGVTVLITLSILGVLLFCFAAVRNKKVNHGHYSPSTQEMVGGARLDHIRSNSVQKSFSNTSTNYFANHNHSGSSLNLGFRQERFV